MRFSRKTSIQNTLYLQSQSALETLSSALEQSALETVARIFRNAIPPKFPFSLSRSPVRKTLLLPSLALALSMLGFSLAATASARPFTTPSGVGTLYFKDESGNMVTVCTISKVSSDKLTAKLGRPEALLSASHCVLDVPTNALTFFYASFDDGMSFLRLKPALRGDLSQGYDFSLWEPLEDKNVARSSLAFNSLKSYPLSNRKELEFGEEIDSWGMPAGLGLTYTKGIVAQPFVDRPIFDKSDINWIGLISADLNCTGGCSGSSIFDSKGDVVAILVGSLFDGTGFKHTYLVPIDRVFQALENDKYILPLEPDKKKDDKKKDASTAASQVDSLKLQFGK